VHNMTLQNDPEIENLWEGYEHANTEYLSQVMDIAFSIFSMGCGDSKTVNRSTTLRRRRKRR